MHRAVRFSGAISMQRVRNGKLLSSPTVVSYGVGIRLVLVTGPRGRHQRAFLRLMVVMGVTWWLLGVPAAGFVGADSRSRRRARLLALGRPGPCCLLPWPECHTDVVASVAASADAYCRQPHRGAG